jgi:hypothetical protein
MELPWRWAILVYILAAAVVLNAAKITLPTRSWVTYKLFAPVAYGGAIATFLAMFLFIKDQGFLDGIVYFFASGYAFVLLGSVLIDGFRSILGLGALGIGGYLAVHVLL